MAKNDKPSIYVTTINLEDADKLLGGLKSHGFDLTKPQHTIFSGKKKGVVCTLYKSGKLTVQGSGLHEFIEFYLEPEIFKDTRFTYPQEKEIDPSARIGVDESGKGDFFGPLVIAGVFAKAEKIKKLDEMGVRDSKTLTDIKVLKLGPQIRTNLPHAIVRISPKKYNELYKSFGNLNHLLAWGHATCIETLANKTGCGKAVVDQFAAEHVVERALKKKGIEITLEQRHRAESDPVVAAASILAREAYLLDMKKLEEKYSVSLPKGSSKKTVETGKKLVERFGSPILNEVAKMHFKTLDSILT